MEHQQRLALDGEQGSACLEPSAQSWPLGSVLLRGKWHQIFFLIQKIKSLSPNILSPVKIF